MSIIPQLTFTFTFLLQSDLDHSYVKVVKHDHEIKGRTESVSLPNTPMVESLDLMEEKQIALLYKAIEDNDIPLVSKKKFLC